MGGKLGAYEFDPLFWLKCSAEPIRSLAQLQEAFRTVAYLYRTEGLLPLWRGHGAVLVRIVPFAAIQFMSHEQYTHLLSVDGDTSPAAKFVAGALAGATGI
jgi:solute carrier family 25 protein 42